MSQTSAFRCNNCKISCSDIDELKTHYKAEIHAINSRRRCATLPPITQQQLDIVRPTVKPKALNTQATISPQVPAPIIDSVERKAPETVSEEISIIEQPPLVPPTFPGANVCIFHNHDAPEFPDIRDALYHMFTVHGFTISDYEYLQEVEKFIEICWATVHVYHTCPQCFRSFSSVSSVLNHISSLRHASPLITDDLNDCFDYTSSYPAGDDDEEDEEMIIIDSRILLAPTGKALICRRDNLNHAMMKLNSNDRLRTRVETEIEESRWQEEDKFRQFELKFMHRHKRYIRKDPSRLRFQKIC